MSMEPLTRLETYLAFLAGEEVGTLPEPLTRAEMYLAMAVPKAGEGQAKADEIQSMIKRLLGCTDQAYDGQMQNLHDEEDPFDDVVGYTFGQRKAAAHLRTWPELGLCLLHVEGSFSAVMPAGYTDHDSFPFDGIDLPPAESDCFLLLDGGIEIGVTTSGGCMHFRNRTGGEAKMPAGWYAFSILYPIAKGGNGE